jgi:enamine deaminase RidA (YjgF/YER057c/UK114 family)
MEFLFLSGIKKLKANGHYSNALVSGKTVYISGSSRSTPKPANRNMGQWRKKLNRPFKTSSCICRPRGSKKDIIKTTAYITDIADWNSANEAYSDFFGSHKPVRSVVPVKELHFGFKIEIEAMAVLA